MSKPLITKLENIKKYLLSIRAHRVKVDLDIQELNELIYALEEKKENS